MIPHYTLLARADEIDAMLPKKFDDAVTVASLVLAGLLVKVTRARADELFDVVRGMMDTIEDIIE
jgi:hypothetical protein